MQDLIGRLGVDLASSREIQADVGRGQSQPAAPLSLPLLSPETGGPFPVAVKEK